MATLTETAYFLQKAFARAGKVLALVILVYIVFRTGSAIFGAVSPPAPPPPTVAFGKLPQLDLGEAIAAPDNLNLRVETISGGIPNLETSAKVFVIKKPDITFGNLDEATKIATKLALSPNSQDLGLGRVKFSDLKQPDRFLTIELALNNFKFESNFLNNSALLDSRPKSIETTTTIATNFLKNFNIGLGDYPPSLIATVLYGVNNGKLVNAISLSSANLVQVIFKRADLDKTGVIYISENDPLVWVIVSDKEVLAGEKASNQIQKYKFATYPLKSATAAFEELKGGKAVFNKLPAGNNFAVRNVRVAYVETRKLQPYLQPVYIFEGDMGVDAFVGAVNNAWIEPVSTAK